MLHILNSLLLRRFVFRMAEASAKRVTGDEPQGTMGRVQTAGEATSRPLSPSRLPLRAHFYQKRDVWVRGSILKSPLNLNRARCYKVRYIASAITRTESGDIFITNENYFIEE